MTLAQHLAKPHLVSGNARLAGVVGDPVSHSLSPAMHGYWCAKHGIDAAYVPLPIKPQHFAEAFRALPFLGFSGVNITLPYKEQVMPLLDVIDPEAEAIGAVNTVVFEDGLAKGFNTDGFGFSMAMGESYPHWQRELKSALVLGAGGATHAIVHELKKAGLSPIYVVNRTPEKSEAVAMRFGQPVKAARWADAEALMAEVGLLVNATSLGMLHQLPLELSIDALPRHAAVMDVVYNPLETDLLRHAREKKHISVSGLGMLIHQGRAAFQHWFGMLPKADETLKVILNSHIA